MQKDGIIIWLSLQKSPKELREARACRATLLQKNLMLNGKPSGRYYMYPGVRKERWEREERLEYFIGAGILKRKFQPCSIFEGYC